MPRINLLKFLPVFAEGGTEGQVMNLVDRLDLSKFAVRFACFNRTGRFLPFLEARGIPVTPYAIKRFYDLRALRQQARLSNDIRRQGVDIVHSYNFYGNVFAIPPARLAATKESLVPAGTAGGSPAAPADCCSWRRC